MRVLFLSIFLMTLLIPTANAETWPDLSTSVKLKSIGKNDVAVIVAVEDYLLLPDVEGAVKNANDWEDFFRKSLKVPTVHVLTNQNATKEAMFKFAKKAAKGVKKNGRIWWVFIGHGSPSSDGKEGLMVGMDAQQTPDSLEARSAGQTAILKKLKTPSVQTIFIVDACFSGRDRAGAGLAKGVQPVVVLNTPAVPKNTIIMTAAKSSEFAGQLTGQARPAFSYLLLGALRGWANNGDGIVTVKEAISFTERELRSVKGRQQTPQAFGDSSFVLSRGAKEKFSLRLSTKAVETDTGNGCSAKNPKRCMKLGNELAYPRDDVPSYLKANAFFGKACRFGLQDGCASLGLAHLKGFGVSKNIKKARSVLKASCKKGSGVGCRGLGDIYKNGIGVREDPKNALASYKQGCNLGNGMACVSVGYDYFGKKDLKNARRFFIIGCKADGMLACPNLAWFYHHGSGGKKNRKIAAKLFREACEVGKQHCHGLAVYYEYGYGGIPKNEKTALKLFTQTCDAGGTRGCRKMAEVRGLGRLGTKKDLRAAAKLHERGCKLEDEVSCISYANFLQSGTGTVRDTKRAVFYYKRACDNKNWHACVNLGVCFEGGIGVKKSLSKAKKLYRQACKAGSSRGCRKASK